MSASVTTTKLCVNVKLDNGTAANGTTKTVSISLGSLDKDAFNADKVCSIVSLLSPVLEKSIWAVEKVETASIEA